MSKPIRLGEVLQQAGMISDFQLASALSHQRNCGGRLGSSLVKLGYLSEDDLLTFLAQQLKLPRIDLFKEIISTDIISLLPADKAREFNVLPVGRREMHGTSWLLVAMSDPTNLLLIDSLQFITGCRVRPALALEKELRDAIGYYYGVVAAGEEPTPPGGSAVKTEPVLTEAKFQALLKVLLDKGVLSLREVERLK